MQCCRVLVVVDEDLGCTEMKIKMKRMRKHRWKAMRMTRWRDGEVGGVIGEKPRTKSVCLKSRVKSACFGFLDTSVIA